MPPHPTPTAKSLTLRMVDFLKLRLEGGSARRRTFAIIVIGMLLTAPALWGGFAQDDHFFLMLFKGSPGLDGAPSSPLDTFSFWKGEPTHRSELLERGLFPWWTADDWRISFWRPLSSLSLWIDFQLFGERAWVMHLHSLLLYGLLGILVMLLYRRFIAVPWVAGLALLLFMVDSGHALPVAWLSQRNSLQALIFGILTLLAHDRWRRLDGRWYPHGFLALLCLALGLLSGEATVSVGAYLFAYALFLDPASTRDDARGIARYGRAIVALLPYLSVTVAWRLVYDAQGHGTSGSWLYTDPVANLPLFVRQLPAYFSVLLLGVFAMPNATLWGALPPMWGGLYLAFSVVFLCVAGWVLWPLLRTKAGARFWGLSALLSTVPVCATYPMDRLMSYPSMGALALVALYLGSYQERASWIGSSVLRRWTASGLVSIWVFAHLIVSPVLLAGGTQLLTVAQRISTETYRALPRELPATDRLVAINIPADLVGSFFSISRSSRAEPVVPHWLYLYAGSESVSVERVDATTLVVRPDRGFITRPAAQIYRHYATHPMRVGHRVSLEGLEIEIVEATEDGCPLGARFSFAVPLEDDTMHWVQWRDGGYVPFSLPGVGETVTVPGVRLATLIRIGLGLDGEDE